jgi:hypothetical protein
LVRSGVWFDQRIQQGSLLLAPGGRIQTFIPVGNGKELSLRYDVRGQFFRQNQQWVSSVTHGIAAGMAFR